MYNIACLPIGITGVLALVECYDLLYCIVVDMEIRSIDEGPVPSVCTERCVGVHVLVVWVLTAVWPAPWAAGRSVGFPCL